MRSSSNWRRRCADPHAGVPASAQGTPASAQPWQARLIEVSVGGRLRRFITSLLCPRTHPAQELAELYHQRWEIELGFREIADPAGG